MDSERARQSSLISSPCNHLASSNNVDCMPEKTCKTSETEMRSAKAMSTFMWLRAREKRGDNGKTEEE